MENLLDIAQNCLNTNFPARWIGRNSLLDISAKSPDLTLYDFLLYGDVKILYIQRVSEISALILTSDRSRQE
jgi:hypothetical protein